MHLVPDAPVVWAAISQSDGPVLRRGRVVRHTAAYLVVRPDGGNHVVRLRNLDRVMVVPPH